ncbi:hypothetical protein B0H22_11225 [Methanohalophilus euhalobius]|uniref:CRISP-associated protein Cas1 n=2 Tax=Methanohalophilus euhalobius TaxID=51203 RepID=A0A314ZZ12_9EURY|nr:hypothetical protein B0H22_11225 [Methanohalophilus euhalobius]RNI10584.1 hypothetical protein EDD83_04335 [Methanohalophilus euhalobius]
MGIETRELAFYLTGRRKNLDFINPVYKVERDDSEELRQKIIDISFSEWKKMGFSKGTLHYMKQNAKSGKPFSLNAHVREKLEEWRIA